LSGDQLETIMTAASDLPLEKRSVFLERCAARLAMRGRRFTDAAPRAKTCEHSCEQALFEDAFEDPKNGLSH
jgi:hypothetical protein